MFQIVIPATDVELESRTAGVGAEGLQVQMSKVSMTNSRTDLNQSARSDLDAVLGKFSSGGLFESSDGFVANQSFAFDVGRCYLN